jgi:aspartate beta-hydroxylase
MNEQQRDAAAIDQLLQEVERAQNLGDRAQAEALLARIKAADPEHPTVLNAAALAELRKGDILSAKTLLERAAARDPRNPRYWLNLAGILRRLNLADQEMAALERILAIEPRHSPALLQKAALLEIMGKRKAAARIFQNALQTIPPNTPVPSALRGLVDRAHHAVRENDARLSMHLEQRLQPSRQQHADADYERFDHCLDVFFGKRAVFTPQPTFLHVPKLRNWEFHPRADFPWLATLEAASETIRDEFATVFAQDQERLEPYIAYGEGIPLDQWAQLNHSRRWSVFYLWRDGRPVPEHLERCPKTAQLLRELPQIDIPGYAPTAFFSILDAKSRIPPHSGVTNARAIVHLPLVIPPNCGFRVGSETRQWRFGEAWVFDDSIEHEAWNESDVPRAILIFDVWNPQLSPAERDLVREAVHGIKDYYQDESPLDGSL